MSEVKPTIETTDSVPSSLAVVREVFEEFNVSDVSDELCTRVLDVLYRHICDIVKESKAIGTHSGHATIEESDMKLAIESLSDGLLFSPPHREQLLAYADKNSQPLPPIRTQHGIRLPVDRNNLTAPNYTLTKPEAEATPLQPTGSDVTVTLSMPTSASQAVFRLTTAATPMGPPSAVRVIAPTGIGASMIRIQSVQSVAQLPTAMDTASPIRAIPLATHQSASLPTIQRRFGDIT